MVNEIYQRLRRIPAVHEVLAELAGDDEIELAAGKAGRQQLINIIRQVLQKARKNISAAELAEPWNLPLEEFSAELSAWRATCFTGCLLFLPTVNGFVFLQKYISLNLKISWDLPGDRD